MKTLNFFYKYPTIITVLYNIFYHMKQKNKDCVIIISGEEGVGKTNFMFHLYELWYEVILGMKVTEENIKNINVNRIKWLKNFKNITELDMNVNDEGADGLSSKESIKKFGRDLEKLYKVFRKKKFFTPILIPDYFDLPPYFRKRARLLFWINKEGKFKMYTKRGITYLNEKNINKHPKSMFVAYPFYTGVFPEYEGVLLKPYLEMSSESVDIILDEIIDTNEGKPKENERDKIIINMAGNGLTHKEIGAATGLTRGRISQIINKYTKDND